MATKTRQATLILLSCVIALCSWMLYSGIFSGAPAAAPAPGAVRVTGVRSRNQGGGAPAGSNGSISLAAKDPTLRLDLLQKVREVKYVPGPRNIFEPYTPPPPPPPPKPIVPEGAAAKPGAPVTPAQPPVPLKFYGIAETPKTGPTKALLADGEDIFIGQEGDIVDKFYRISHIGVNSLEVEDTRTHQRSNLSLQAE